MLMELDYVLEKGAGTAQMASFILGQKKEATFKIFKDTSEYGAPADIQIDAHPHIGSNKLPKIIQAIRNDISLRGGDTEMLISFNN